MRLARLRAERDAVAAVADADARLRVLDAQLRLEELRAVVDGNVASQRARQLASRIAAERS